MKVTQSVISALCFTLIGVVLAHAQGDGASGRIVGVLVDRTGAAVPYGTVEVRGRDSKLATSTTSDTEGRYVVGALPPGRYDVSAVAPGLEKAVRADVTVTANAETAADFTLDLARRQVFVEVTAPAGRTPLMIETDPRTPRQPIPAHDGAEYLKTIPGSR